jgi:hypothetical protein
MFSDFVEGYTGNRAIADQGNFFHRNLSVSILSDRTGQALEMPTGDFRH